MYGALVSFYTPYFVEASLRMLLPVLKADISYLHSDTPWDEPTASSPEFCRYVSGTIFAERPWSRIPSEPLCRFPFIGGDGVFLSNKIAFSLNQRHVNH